MKCKKYISIFGGVKLDIFIVNDIKVLNLFVWYIGIYILYIKFLWFEEIYIVYIFVWEIIFILDEYFFWLYN